MNIYNHAQSLRWPAARWRARRRPGGLAAALACSRTVRPCRHHSRRAAPPGAGRLCACSAHDRRINHDSGPAGGPRVRCAHRSKASRRTCGWVAAAPARSWWRCRAAGRHASARGASDGPISCRFRTTLLLVRTYVRSCREDKEVRRKGQPRFWAAQNLRTQLGAGGCSRLKPFCRVRVASSLPLAMMPRSPANSCSA